MGDSYVSRSMKFAALTYTLRSQHQRNGLYLLNQNLDVNRRRMHNLQLLRTTRYASNHFYGPYEVTNDSLTLRRMPKAAAYRTGSWSIYLVFNMPLSYCYLGLRSVRSASANSLSWLSCRPVFSNTSKGRSSAMSLSRASPSE